MKQNIFSAPQKTIEAAKALYQYDLLTPAAVFETADGFVLGYLQVGNWPPHEAATAMRQHGYNMVACCDSLFGIWKPYQYEVTA